MKARNALIAWTPTDWPSPSRKGTAGKVKIGELLNEIDSWDWTNPYVMTGGAAYIAMRQAKGWHAVAMTFIEFHTMVIRDGIDPQEAHKAFLAIDEYRQRIAPDIDGAEILDSDELAQALAE